MRRVRGIAPDGTTVTITIGKTPIQCLSVSYGDNITPEKLRQMGSQSIDALTPGTYETEDGTVKMSSDVFRADLMPLLDDAGFGNRTHQIVAATQHPDLGTDSDALLARMTGLKTAAENSSKALEVEFKLTVVQIWWGDSRKTINAQDPSIPLGTSKL